MSGLPLGIEKVNYSHMGQGFPLDVENNSRYIYIDQWFPLGVERADTVILMRPNKKDSCVQVSLPTLTLGPTLKMLNYFFA